MSTTLLKLHQRDGLTRRLIFSKQPTWRELAHKIESLYDIPIERVSVAYVDSDGDEVTLSSQEELEDFYQVSHQSGQTIKFTVQDLTSFHSHNKELPDTRPLNFRNTFGQAGLFDTDDDWQRLPPFSGLGDLVIPRAAEDQSPHAFVEVIGSDVETISNFGAANADDNNRHSPIQYRDDAYFQTLDKGKGRATTEDEISSTGSVLAEDAPPKHPVHVYDIASRVHVTSTERHNQTLGSISPTNSNHSTLPAVAESTPKAATQTLSLTGGGGGGEAAVASSSLPETEDPPLPSIDLNFPSSTSSLSSDVAALLATFRNVVAAHPELSEGIRNIIQNASTGTYWNTHRDAISRAAEDIVQSAGATTEELRKKAEEEAGKRVADALGGVFEVLSRTVSSADTSQPPAPSTQSPEERGHEPHPPPASNSTSFWYGPAPPARPPWRGATLPPAPNNPWLRGRLYHPRGAWDPLMPSPLGPHGGNQVPGMPPPPPPAAPPAPWDPEHHFPWGLGSTPTFRPSHDPPRGKPSPQELKAQVESAKARYKAEKERYRQEREDRKKERERKAHAPGSDGPVQASPPANSVPTNNSLSAVNPAPPALPAKSKPAAIVSHSRGDYPAFELVSVHRHNTHPGHSGRRHGTEHGDLATRTLARISKRLADMGFTESAHPQLPSKIRARVPSNGFVTKDGEDDIVTTLLEELLAMSPKPSMNPGFGSGDRAIPGAWH